ncbi:hypothetical protein HP499_22255 [Paenarthrobacter sp. CM16]|uniref:LysM peptidoglycan-binding domain-containing protein n=1 Tax=Paenarthrobacter sp. CM16 TaxID=2738447 RepID=UPI001557E080|nr:LysM domain-containing protein [Paenarthrobacter sp. CM16]NQD90510.1 hypothetical protein [Paenarthrobacter sp. CM16]
MARQLRSDACLAATILGLGLLLVFVGAKLLEQWRSAGHHHQSFSFENLLGLLATGSGLALVAWWILSLLLAFLASLLHLGGRKRGANALAKFSPAFMLRLAVAMVGLNLLGGPMAQAAPPTPDPGWGTAMANVAPSPHPAWTPTSVAGPAPASPRSMAETPPEARDPRWKPKSPATDPGLLSRPSTRQENSPKENGVVVKVGDSLWSIAAARLGPLATDVDIALMWPKWYAANRSAIGVDPSALIPGQILRPPLPG